MLAPLSKDLNQTDKNEIETAYRMIAKKILGVRRSIETCVIEKLTGNISEFNNYNYNRILSKINNRFESNHQDFYQRVYQKINHKLIPSN